jgi:serine/threonine protein kinase
MPSSLATNAVDAATLADELARFRVIAPERLNELLSNFSSSGSAALADYLIRTGVLTQFQVNRALAGETGMLALGPYRITGIAGQGTFGPLYHATHISKPGAFNVRVMPLRNLWKARQAKQLSRVLSSGAQHPGVVPLVEVDSANGYHYLVWPQVDAELLADRVNANGPMTPGETVAMLGHLANAIAACHARNIAHGAITPLSVAIAPNSLPLLLELGSGTLLAQNLEADESILDSLSAAFASATVLTYAAPELALSPLTPTLESDQYALGAIGYFALTGLSPYPHQTLAEEMRAKWAGPPPAVSIVNPAVPQELSALLERLMSPNPQDRFPSLAEVEQSLAALALFEPNTANESSVVESLMLSQLQDSRGGAISWTTTESGALKPAERDSSDASITFDLPEAAETLPDGLAYASEVIEPVDTPPSLPVTQRHDSKQKRPSLALPKSPARTEAKDMAKNFLSSLTEPGKSKVPPPPDPRLTPPTPVQWHSTEEQDGESSGSMDKPPANSLMWKKLRRNVLFWRASTDPVQVSVFGPLKATPGQSIKLTIYLHTPDAAGNVRTLSRAFQHDAELIGTGFVAQEIARATELAVHVSVANAGVSRTLMKCTWRGQPHRLNYELHVPWESAEGSTPGIVSIGQNDVRVGKIEFRLNILPRKA